ncbi:MAG: hypothetical protein IJV39_02995 [Ruminococcus sp.]|nr:hypothetical protein [Ruminococcus sp.]
MKKLIIVEGLPCSGKSTTSKYIANRLNAKYFDEGSGLHPADYEFHAFIKNSDLNNFSNDEQKLIKADSIQKFDGYIVELKKYTGDFFDRLLKYKIYDFLPWETEKPIMLDKWSEFVNSIAPGDRYVFNCVLLQNPMCETMMRFGFDTAVSAEYIGEICNIIKPLEPFVVYLKYDNIRSEIEKAVSERDINWLNGVIEYHCNGMYGRANHLNGFDGYITALEERQRRELEILQSLNIQYVILDNPYKDWEESYSEIISKLNI